MSCGGVFDENFSLRSFILNAIGDNNSTAFVDGSNNKFAISNTGGVKIVKPLTNITVADSGAYFSGGTSYLSLPANANVNDFGTGDFCIESWVRFSDVSNEYIIIDCGTSWPSSGAYSLEIRSGGDLRFWAGNNNPVAIASGTGAIVANKDHFVEVSRVNGVIKIFIDGVKKGTDYTGNAVTVQSSAAPKIGIFRDNTSPMNGYIMSMRISKGIGGNTANYSPPASAWFPSN